MSRQKKDYYDHDSHDDYDDHDDHDDYVDHDDHDSDDDDWIDDSCKNIKIQIRTVQIFHTSLSPATLASVLSS